MDMLWTSPGLILVDNENISHTQPFVVETGSLGFLATHGVDY